MDSDMVTVFKDCSSIFFLGRRTLHYLYSHICAFRILSGYLKSNCTLQELIIAPAIIT